MANPYPAKRMELLITSSLFQLVSNKENAIIMAIPQISPTLDKNNNQRILQFCVK